jgi:hypothetical protein
LIKKLQPLVENEAENECIQQSKEIEKCAYDNSEENEEGFESGERTLPLCFASFKLLKKNVYNVSNKNPPGMRLNMKKEVDLQMKTIFHYVFLPLNC